MGMWTVKSCGKKHGWCKECRVDIQNKMKGVPSKLRGRTYEDIHGLEKASELRSQRFLGVLRDGSGRLGKTHTEDSKLKMRNSALGRIISAETRRKMSESHKNRNSKQISKQRREIVKRHNEKDLPTCKCYVHGGARPYMISSFTWLLADVLVVLGFSKVIAEEQFGRYRVDVLLGDEWLGFEADGKYHFTEERKKYDKDRDKKF